MRTAAGLVMAAAAVFAQSSTPEFTNARVETRAVQGSISAEFQKAQSGASSPMWMAYTVPMVAGRHGTWCGDDQRTRKLMLEGPDTLVVLFRFEKQALDRVRVATIDCQFDAGGLPVALLTGVVPAQSVELLTGLATAQAQKGRAHVDQLVSAIAMHRDATADRALESMIATSQPEVLREKALFWLANSRGRSGFEAVRKVLQSDPSDRMREKAAFDMTLTHEPEAMPVLEQAAKSDKTPHVRSQAWFWLARRGGEQEASRIAEAARQDPDAGVRRQAVFALEQIPGGKGIPELIRLVKGSSDPKVREQAMFWLGRSKDPQAVRFFEDVLK